MKELIVATNNKNKLKEIKEILKDYKLLSLEDIEIEDVIENGKTIEENSLIKAKTIYLKYKKPTIADDSGLFVESLNDEPGVNTARYAGDDKNNKKNIEKLLNNLKDIKNRKAKFKTVITYYDNDYFQVEGVLDGEIAKEEKGNSGFGYDSVFIYKGKTLAELSSIEKNKISHRRKALDKLKEKLDDIR